MLLIHQKSDAMTNTTAIYETITIILLGAVPNQNHQAGRGCRVGGIIARPGRELSDIGEGEGGMGGHGIIRKMSKMGVLE